MATSPKDTAQFVFTGTVQRLNAATLKAVTDKEKTIVVVVNEIHRAPEALRDFAGHKITVELAKGERVKKGQQAVFYTNGWLFGESLAVRSVGHDPVKGAVIAAAGATSAAGSEPARAAQEGKIRKRASEASLIVSGKVVAVGQPAAPITAAAAGGPGDHEPISEHAPFWTEAVINVDKVHRGTVGKKQLVVRFPTSTDVRWYHAPKFQVGQEGVFMLNEDQVSGLESVGVTAAAFHPAGTYTCLHPVDFVPADHEAEVATAIAAAHE
jgi:hypothetical protein